MTVTQPPSRATAPSAPPAAQRVVDQLSDRAPWPPCAPPPRRAGLLIWEAAAGHEVDLDLAFPRQGSTPRLESPEGDPTTGTLVNVSRGSVVDDPALTALPNGTLYPHHASGTKETRGRMAQLTRDNLDAFFAGRPLPTPIAVFVPAASLARMTVPLLTNADARRLFLDRHLLLGQGSGPARGADLAGVLDDLGFVQVDSVNTLARSHDLILWSRRGRYRPASLDHLVARHRAAFEHWTHDAAIVPMRFYPMWRLKFARDEARIRRRWPAWQGEGWDREIDAVLQRIADHGPASSLEVGDDAPRKGAGWWDWHPSKVALEYLWRSGRLAISHRRGFRKVYDLAERVIPAQVRDVRLEAPEVIDWAMSAAMDRLGFATSGELAAFFEIATRDEARQWCADALSAGRITAVDVEMADGSRRRSFSTASLLDGLASLPQPSGRVRLLSPFDPALRDRARAERLFGFRYRIEIFVPAPRRRYGYYVFPVMQGCRLIGRLDAKREGGVLAVRAFWPEAGVRMGRARQAGLTAELQRILPLARTAEIRFAPDWLRA